MYNQLEYHPMEYKRFLKITERKFLAIEDGKN